MHPGRPHKGNHELRKQSYANLSTGFVIINLFALLTGNQTYKLQISKKTIRTHFCLFAADYQELYQL